MSTDLRSCLEYIYKISRQDLWYEISSDRDLSWEVVLSTSYTALLATKMDTFIRTQDSLTSHLQAKDSCQKPSIDNILTKFSFRGCTYNRSVLIRPPNNTIVFVNSFIENTQ